MKVLKFGGSSVGDTDKIRNVIEIIKKSIGESKKVAVVFSAFHKVTDNLLKMGQLAASYNTEYIELFKKLEERHISIAQEMLKVQTQSTTIANLKYTLNELEDVLHGVYLIAELSPRTLDFILSFGERMSSFIIANALMDSGVDCEYLDSRNSC